MEEAEECPSVTKMDRFSIKQSEALTRATRATNRSPGSPAKSVKQPDIFETKSRVSVVSNDVKKNDRKLNLLTSKALSQMDDSDKKIRSAASVTSFKTNKAKHRLTHAATRLSVPGEIPFVAKDEKAADPEYLARKRRFHEQVQKAKEEAFLRFVKGLQNEAEQDKKVAELAKKQNEVHDSRM